VFPSLSRAVGIFPDHCTPLPQSPPTPYQQADVTTLDEEMTVKEEVECVAGGGDALGGDNDDDGNDGTAHSDAGEGA
jgi:hypothetical protein